METGTLEILGAPVKFNFELEIGRRFSRKKCVERTGNPMEMTPPRRLVASSPSLVRKRHHADVPGVWVVVVAPSLSRWPSLSLSSFQQ
jgi:hypothetical protein